MKCRQCGNEIIEHYKPPIIGGDEEYSLECPICGELDPTDLIDKCVKCGVDLEKNEYLYCKNCKEVN